jgi:histone deacetylase complex regulatory component SIN3
LLENYLNFLIVTNLFLSLLYIFCRIDVEGVVSTVKELFKEHEELLLKFNDYVPEKYKVANVIIFSFSFSIVSLDQLKTN